MKFFASAINAGGSKDLSGAVSVETLPGTIFRISNPNDTSNELKIAEALKEIFAEEGMQSESLLTSADNNGAWVTREPVDAGQRSVDRVIR